MKLINLAQNKSKISDYLSYTLLKEIDKNLKKGKKIILYLNKRGNYSSLICTNCNHVYKCKNCDITLSIHDNPEKMVCHMCSNKKNIDIKCEKCNSKELLKVGVGTQQIENTIRNIYKNKQIFRFDTDTVKNKKDKKEALKNINESDIIIGTKMITTGFNIKNLGLIGVILLEQELKIAKYNTEEKVYSNIKQLIGRGNRVGEKTEILIQTFIPENETIDLIVNGNYKDFFIKTLEERKIFNYPPFTEMIEIEYRDKNLEKTKKYIKNLEKKLTEEKDENIEVKIVPNIKKFNNNFHAKIIIKGKNLREFLKCIKSEIIRNSNLQIIF